MRGPAWRGFALRKSPDKFSPGPAQARVSAAPVRAGPPHRSAGRPGRRLRPRRRRNWRRTGDQPHTSPRPVTYALMSGALSAPASVPVAVLVAVLVSATGAAGVPGMALNHSTWLDRPAPAPAHCRPDRPCRRRPVCAKLPVLLRPGSLLVPHAAPPGVPGRIGVLAPPLLDFLPVFGVVKAVEHFLRQRTLSSCNASMVCRTAVICLPSLSCSCCSHSRCRPRASPTASLPSMSLIAGSPSPKSRRSRIRCRRTSSLVHPGRSTGSRCCRYGWA